MTATVDRDHSDLGAADDLATAGEQLDVDPAGPGDGFGVPDAGDDGYDPGPLLRPLAVAALTSTAAALMAGGIFGSWPARLLATGGALLGIFWAWFCIRSPKNLAIKQAAVAPVAFLVGILSLTTTTDGPAKVFSLMSDAISSGRLLRPPVPFDPGWRPLLIMLFTLLGFAGGWVAVSFRRPQLALVLPMPILGLAAISQPAEGEFVAGFLAFIPVLLALALLFGGDTKSVSELDATFELKRAVKSSPLIIGGILLLVLLGQTDFLFPKPVFTPTQKPQKPKAIPLGAVRDRVLFEADGPITGPWKVGQLDVYDGTSWRLSPFDAKRMKKVPSDGVVDKGRTGNQTVKITIGDLGTSSVLPGVTGPMSIKISGLDVVYDPRVGVFRLPAGRVPQGQMYEVSLPTFPTAEQLRAARPPTGRVDKDFTAIPRPTPIVEKLLAEAPTNTWDRLDFLRKKLNDVVIAAGPGEPSKPVPPSKVDDLLAGSHEGSPFEIVAAEAMLARWAGLPSRIGYGFDGVNDENGKKTVRPKNGSNWLEVYFEGYGWVPLIGTPPKAKSTLNTDPNAKFNASIAPSDDVAVQLYIPVELDNLRQLYQRVRQFLLELLPFLVGMAIVYLALPSVRRLQRRRKRRAWARAEGLREEIAVEYTEFRDAAFDLNVGDRHDTPLEFLAKVAEDDEHSELAWLVTRSTYGDLINDLDETDVDAAREMATSLRKRMFRAQPLQSRILGLLSRASLRDPYTLEVPNVRLLRLRRRGTTGPNVQGSSTSRATGVGSQPDSAIRRLVTLGRR